MPQMNKGGKFIFGKSIIQPDGAVQIPAQAIQEYQITTEGRVYLFTGSKVTGGFCVTRKGLLEPSKLGHILTENPDLLHYTAAPGVLQRAFLLLDHHYKRWKNRPVQKHDGFSGTGARKRSPVHPKQRHCFHNGRKRSPFGESAKL